MPRLPRGDEDGSVTLPHQRSGTGGARMGAVRFRAAVELRRYWRGSVVLAVLAGMGGGLALATLAGARRTDSALGRFVGGAGLQADAIVELGSEHQLPRDI